MTKEEIFKMLEKAISCIDKNFNSEDVEPMLEDPLREANLPFSWSVEAGISKAVILIQGEPFVIKMPFFKLWDDDYCDEESKVLESCLRDIEGASNIFLGEGIEPAIPDWDYCRLESVIYQLALEEGLGAYFAEEGYLGTIDKTPVYYQTRCTPMNSITIDYNSADYEKKENKSTLICKKLQVPCFNEVWISDFVDLYGEKEFKRLSSFLARYEIGDLRTCNIGYLDGAPILFDYSSYRDW